MRLARVPRRWWKAGLALALPASLYMALTPLDLHADKLPHVDKLMHVGAFAALTVLGLLSWPQWQARVAVGMVGYGVLIEVLQGFVPLRAASWLDVLADALGVGLGVVLWRRLTRQV